MGHNCITLVVTATLVQQIHFCREFLLESRSKFSLIELETRKNSRNMIALLINISKIQLTGIQDLEFSKREGSSFQTLFRSHDH